LNKTHNTRVAVVPHIVHLPNTNETLRDKLLIPPNATVFGRLGGLTEFDIPVAHQAIQEFVAINPHCYFLFMNTRKFFEHPQIIYLEANLDPVYKVKFINTCDAMIHARKMGETFGMAIAEFSHKNKPVITCKCGDLEHIEILGEKALLYSSKKELLDIFANIKMLIASRHDWNAHKLYTPEHVMNLLYRHMMSVHASS
jgi:hypothetical protein